jgi:outer membrane immunogenic protein
MRKSLIAAAAVAVLTGSPALAADLGLPSKAPPPFIPPPTWTGCYVNGGAGYGFWNQNQYQETFPGLVPTSANVNSGGEGWLGRVGGGCDYEFGVGGLGNFVIGVFGDYDFMNIHGQMSPGDTVFVGNENESGAWYVGGRVGYLVTPNFLTFFDAGYTQTHYDSISLGSLPVPAPAGFVGETVPANTYRGWFFGGGTEYALNFSWLPIHGLFWRNEWRYASYETVDLPLIPGPGGAAGIGIHAEKDVQTITSSLVWRFTWPGAYVMQ